MEQILSLALELEHCGAEFYTLIKVPRTESSKTSKAKRPRLRLLSREDNSNSLEVVNDSLFRGMDFLTWVVFSRGCILPSFCGSSPCDSDRL